MSSRTREATSPSPSQPFVEVVHVHQVDRRHEAARPGHEGVGQRGLARARPVRRCRAADRSPGSVARRRHRLSTRSTVAAGTLGSEDMSQAAVGRHHVDERVARSRCTTLVCSNSSPDLACRNHTRSPIREQRGRVAGQRRLHLAGALEPGQVQPGGRPRDAAAGPRPAGPEATNPPPCDGGQLGDGLRRRPAARSTPRGAASKRLVVVEQARAPAARTRRRPR